MATVKTLKIALELSDGKTKTLSLLDPKNNLGLSEVTQWANNAIAKEFITVNNATISGLEDAYIQTVTREDLA